MAVRSLTDDFFVQPPPPKQKTGTNSKKTEPHVCQTSQFGHFSRCGSFCLVALAAGSKGFYMYAVVLRDPEKSAE